MTAGSAKIRLLIQSGNKGEMSDWKNHELQDKRRNILQALREHGFEVLREGRRHTIYSRCSIRTPVSRKEEHSKKPSVICAKFWS